VAGETKTKELMRPMPLTWWLTNPSYTWFMVRDVTSIFIAGYCVFLLVLLYRANQGPESFKWFYASLGSWVSTILHLIALAFAAYHSVTFFNLTPRVMVVFRGDEKVPDKVIAGLHFGLWALVSVVLIVIAFAA
jgi:fumarate reductase subunit C